MLARLLSRAPLGLARLYISLRVPLEVDPPAIKAKVTVCPSIERESEESPSIDSHSSSYTTEALSEVMKEESPSATHHRIAILQGRHRSEIRGITLGTRCQLCRVEQLRGVCGAVLFSARSIALIGAQ